MRFKRVKKNPPNHLYFLFNIPLNNRQKTLIDWTDLKVPEAGCL